MVSSVMGRKHAQVSSLQDIKKIVRFEVFQTLTSVCFSKLHKKPNLYYYLLHINNIHEKIIQK